MRPTPFILFAALLACAKADPKTPDGAFAMLAPCVDRSDARCLYEGLDRDSQWSVQTIYRALSEISTLANATYPDSRRRDAYGSWAGLSKAPDPAGLFEAYCRQQNCLDRIKKGFGAVINVVKKSRNAVLLETTRGGQFEMRQAEGRFGLALFQEALQREKIRVLDRLGQVKQDARAFDEMRKAGNMDGLGLETRE
ncbi:MAG: hypothetical protein QNJ97_02390 [Myxococcota bacterium]|nr:hypothetical protein [Myxococcota bacterium]